MEHIISRLLGRYESGTLTRRDLVKGLAMLSIAGETASAAAAQDKGFKAASINHVSIQCSNIQRTAEFYMRAFGLPKRTATNLSSIRLGVGPSHLTLRQEKPNGNVDHFCLGIDNFNHDAVVRDLKARGVTPEPDETTPQGFHVKDPDGFRVQLGDSSEF